MQFDPRDFESMSSRNQRERIDAICREFEDAWYTSSRVFVEDLLFEHTQLPREFLLYRLLVSEMRLLANGEFNPSLSHYLRRFPNDEWILRAIWEPCCEQSRDRRFHDENGSSHTTTKSFRIVDARRGNLQSTTPRNTTHPTFPGYKIHRLLGKGGMGIVYLGWDEAKQRWVALKTLRSDVAWDTNCVKRFRNEILAYKQIAHRNLVRFLEHFEYQGLPVLVLEYARGGSLADILKRGIKLPPKVAAKIIEQLASAVALAHELKLLHRDITPSNILFDFSEDRIDGDQKPSEMMHGLEKEILQDHFDWGRLVPKLSDFGLLLSLEESEALSSITSHGQVVGTPSYMAPESISPKFGTPSFQTDVYGLGACLYSSLTGKPPHVGFNIVDTMHRVVSDEVVAPRLIASQISMELNEICMKCLARHPEGRFASVADLYEDLVRLRNGEKPRFARSPGRMTKAIRWCRKNQVISVAMLLILCTGLMLTAFSYRSYRDAVHQQSLIALEAIALEELVVIREELASQFDLVKAVGIYASEHDMSSPEQFQEFCGPLIASHSAIKALSWAACVPDSMRTNFEAKAQFSGGNHHFIYERSDTGEAIPASIRSHYIPVQFIVPWSDNRQALGFDLASEQTRLVALQRAEQQNDLAITGLLQLVQDEEPAEAFLAVYPVWKETRQETSPLSDDPVALRRQSLKGFASGVFHTADVIEPCLKFARSHLWIRICDVTDGKKIVYSMPELKQDPMGSNPPPLVLTNSFENVGSIWEIEFFEPHHRRTAANWAGLDRIIVGLFLTSVLTGIPLFFCRFFRPT